MIPVIVIAALSVVGLALSSLLCPNINIKGHSFSTFYIAPLIGLILLLSIGLLPVDDYIGNLLNDTSVNPLQILVIFFSMALLSTALDETGFFKYLASVLALKAKHSQMALFLILYGLISVLTVFTSNDIIVITFTPFIVFFCKRSKVNPLPYLIGEFVAANTWSTFLIVGNPTNIYLAGYFGVDFFDYMAHMALPTLFCGLTALGLLVLVFRRKLALPLSGEGEIDPIKDEPMFIASAVLLGASIILLSVSSYIDLPMWEIALGAAVLMLIFLSIYSMTAKKARPLYLSCLKRLPYGLAPFLLSMAGIVLSLDLHGFTGWLADFLSGLGSPILSYGVAGYVFANVFNNIPMSILMGDVLSKVASLPLEALYADILASNVAAFFSPLGALAGVMFMGLLRNSGVKYSFGDFLKYGAIVGIPTFFMGLFGLYLTFLFI